MIANIFSHSLSELSFSFVEGFLFYANVSGRLGPVFLLLIDVSLF